MIFYEYNHKQTIRRKILHRDIGSLMQKQTEEVLVNGELYTYMHTKKIILVIWVGCFFALLTQTKMVSYNIKCTLIDSVELRMNTFLLK